MHAAPGTDARTGLASSGRGRRFHVCTLFALRAMMAVMLFAATAERAAAQTGSATPVNIPDPNLRTMLEVRLSKSAGETITRAEMASLTGDLNLEHSYWDPTRPSASTPATVVRDLTGLEYLTGVEGLRLMRHRITDLSPLAGLTQLTRLWLSFNQITDLSPLARLTQLNFLSLDFNEGITDLSPLARLTRMNTLHVAGARITDLSPLRGLTQIRILTIRDNPIVA